MKIGKREKNIPVPRKKNGPQGMYKPILDKLEVGESQVLYDVALGALHNAIWKYNRNHGRLIVSAQVKKTGPNKGDKRIWRLS